MSQRAREIEEKKWEVRNIGFWADMLINFFSTQV